MGNPVVPEAPVESGYSRVNLFLGKQKVPKDGHLRLPHARVRILWGRETPAGWVQDDKCGDPWLIVQNAFFWHVMVRLDPTQDEVSWPRKNPLLDARPMPSQRGAERRPWWRPW